MDHLRPLRIGETVDISTRLWVRNLWDLVKIFLVFLVPITAIRLLVSAAVADDVILSNRTLYCLRSDACDTYNAVSMTLFVVQALTGLVALGACVHLLGQRYLRRRATWTEALKAAFSRFWVLLGATILFGLGIMAGFIALIIPGVFLLVAWWLYHAAVMIEHKGPADALRRSFDLVRGRWWPTFGALIVGLIVYVMLAFVAPVLLYGATAASNSALMFMVLNALLSLLTTVLGQPLLAALEVVIYFELRVRKEGFDLEIQAQQLGETRREPPVPKAPPAFEASPPEEPPWRRTIEDHRDE